jgi:hypothetical protein
VLKTKQNKVSFYLFDTMRKLHVKVREPVAAREKALFAAVVAVGGNALVALLPVDFRRATAKAFALEPVHEQFVVLERRGLVVELALFAVREIALEKRLETAPVAQERQERAYDVLDVILDVDLGGGLDVVELDKLFLLGKEEPFLVRENVHDFLDVGVYRS